MRAAARIAMKDLKLRVRDRSVFILGIAAPLVLAFIFNAVFGGATDGTGLGLEYGIVDQDESEVSAQFADVLEGAEAEGVLTVDTYDTEAEAEAALDDGVIDAYFSIPPGFMSAVVAAGSTTIEVVGDVDAPVSTQIAAAFAERFSAGIAAVQLAVATSFELTGFDPDQDSFAGFRSPPARAAEVFALVDQSAETKQLDATTYLAAGMAVFFLFFTVQYGVLGLLEEERQGTMSRLMAAPINRASIIAGKGLMAFLMGVVSMAVLVIATGLLLGADWGDPLGVAILVVAGVLAAIGIMGLVSAFAKTPEGAGNLGSIIAVILGMLGGTFFPIGDAGGFLTALTRLTPHSWFLRGLGDLTADAPWTAAIPAAGAILAFAVATGSVAWYLLRRRWVA